MSPSQWLTLPMFRIMLALAVPGIFIPTVPWLQVFIPVVCCALIFACWRLVRGMVLVIAADRFWPDATSAQVYGVSERQPQCGPANGSRTSSASRFVGA